MAGIGLGSSLLECLALYIIMGMNGALETLVAQAYGADQLVLCGVYLNRARVINTIVILPLIFVLIFTKPLLSALGQQEEVVEHASSYVVNNLLSVYLLGMFDLNKRFLSCLKTTWVPMLI